MLNYDVRGPQLGINSYPSSATPWPPLISFSRLRKYTECFMFTTIFCHGHVLVFKVELLVWGVSARDSDKHAMVSNVSLNDHFQRHSF